MAERARRFGVRRIAFPDADVIEGDDNRIVVVGKGDVDAAAVTIDVAFEIDAGGFGHAILRRYVGIVGVLYGRRMAAIAAGIEIAGPIAKIDAEPECILEDRKVRVFFGADEELHHADFLQRMLRQVRGVVAAHEAGIGFRFGQVAGEHPLGKIGVELLVVGEGRPGRKDTNRGQYAGQYR